MKGWYGKSFEHKLASKGIKTKQGIGFIGKKKIFPHSFKTMTVRTIQINFKDGEMKIYPLKEWIDEVYSFIKFHGIQIEDRDGIVRDIELKDIKYLAYANPQPLTELMQSMYGKEIASWGGGMEDVPVTEYYSSFRNKNVIVKGKPFSDPKDRIKEGKVIKESPEYTEGWGWNTYYTVEDNKGRKDRYVIHEIESVDGKDPKEFMVAKLEGELGDDKGLAQR